jgi:aspartate racemase
MKTIGILGGLGPESTIEYYRGIIKALNSKTPETDYPKIIIYSANMTELWKIIEAKKFDTLTVWLTDKIKSLYEAGAEFAAIASNTPHVVFEEVRLKSPIPVLSIVEETCKKAKSMDLKKCGLFGTGFTMQSSFYQDYFNQQGISIVVPDEDDRNLLDEKIFSELEFGVVKDQTRKQFLHIAKKMIDTESINSLILACTELPLILSDSEYGIPFLSTTAIHIESIVKFCLSQ